MMEMQTELVAMAVAVVCYLLHVTVFSVRKPQRKEMDKLADDESIIIEAPAKSRRKLVLLPLVILFLTVYLWTFDEAIPKTDPADVPAASADVPAAPADVPAAPADVPAAPADVPAAPADVPSAPADVPARDDQLSEVDLWAELSSSKVCGLEQTLYPIPFLNSSLTEDVIKEEFQVQKKQPLISYSSPIPKSDLLTWNLTRHRLVSHSDGELVYYKSAYWGWLTVGQPAQTFKVVFDTGSGHLILPSMYCRSETCRMHRRYSRLKSKTATDIDVGGELVKPGSPRDQITVSFGTGTITGVYMEESICMDGAESGPTPNNHAMSKGCLKLRFVAAIDMTPEPFKTFKFDGILGLGLPDLSQTDEFNYMSVLTDTLSDQGYGKHQTFAVFLSRHDSETSELTVGGWNDAHVDGNVYWNSVFEPEHGHWLLKVKRVTFDGVPFEYCNEGCKAVVDTGSSLMAVPSPAFPEIWEALRHPADPDGKCEGPGPVMRFELDNYVVEVGPEIYAGLERSNVAAPSMPFPENNTVYCKPILMSMELPAPIGPRLFILGEPVLRKYVTVYDVKEKRIGFGRANHMPDPPEDEDEDDWWYE